MSQIKNHVKVLLYKFIHNKVLFDKQTNINIL